MSTLDMMIEAIKNNVFEAMESGDREKTAQAAEQYLGTIKTLKKGTRAAYAGLELFLEIILWYSSPSGSAGSEQAFDRITERFASLESAATRVPDWKSGLDGLKASREAGAVPSPGLFAGLSGICAPEASEGGGESPSGTVAPGLNPAGANFIRYCIEFLLGLLLCGAVAGMGYLAYRGSFNGILASLGKIAVALPVWLGKGLGFAGIVLVTCAALSPLHFAICGIGKIHYRMGTRGYMLKFFLAFLVFTPLVLPLVFFSGKGLRRILTKELVVAGKDV